MGEGARRLQRTRARRSSRVRRPRARRERSKAPFAIKSVVYDAGALLAADRNDRRFWARHRARLELGLVPIVPALVVAQVGRSPKQVQLRRLLRGCEIAVFDEPDAHQTGALLDRARTSNAVNAAVVVAAAARGADIVSSDRRDVEHLIAVERAAIRVIDP